MPNPRRPIIRRHRAPAPRIVPALRHAIGWCVVEPRQHSSKFNSFARCLRKGCRPIRLAIDGGRRCPN
jgi:hypothetical protein